MIECLLDVVRVSMLNLYAKAELLDGELRTLDSRLMELEREPKGYENEITSIKAAMVQNLEQDERIDLLMIQKCERVIALIDNAGGADTDYLQFRRQQHSDLHLHLCETIESRNKFIKTLLSEITAEILQRAGIEIYPFPAIEWDRNISFIIL